VYKLNSTKKGENRLDAEKIEPKRHKIENGESRMERKKWLAFPFIISFTIYDILIMEGLFTHLQIRHNIQIFHLYWMASYLFLIPLFMILISLKLRSWHFLMYSLVGIYCGWLDILFFLLQGKTLPKVYTWWPFSPTNLQLIALATITLIVALFIDFRVKDQRTSIITPNTKVSDG
jgi:hypothetical protein